MRHGYGKVPTDSSWQPLRDIQTESGQHHSRLIVELYLRRAKTIRRASGAGLAAAFWRSSSMMKAFFARSSLLTAFESSPAATITLHGYGTAQTAGFSIPCGAILLKSRPLGFPVTATCS